MWRGLWRSIDRFSLQYFKYIINELRSIKVVDKLNRELVVDLLQSIVEIVTYGDRHNPSIFDCFMEYQVLAEFVRVLKISRNSRIEAPLLQYLSIMIQNMDSEHAIYYSLSNDYINSIITHQYEFDGGDLAPYYVSFLRAVSGKLNRDTLCLLVKVHEDVVVSFPLYSEALKFAHHGEKMIQIAVRALTLNIFNVADEMVYRFVTTPPVSEYFSELVLSLRKQCFQLDALVPATVETCNHERRKELILETEKIVDDLYYLKDILCVGNSRLSKMVTQNLVSLLIFPILLPLLQLSPNSGTHLSAATSLYVVSRLVQVVEGKNIVNFVVSAILCPYMSSSMRDATESVTTDGISQASSFANHLCEMEEIVCPEPEGVENFKWNYLLGPLSMQSNSHFVSFPSEDVHKERGGILPYILSDNHSLMLASLMLLLVLVESKDLDNQLAAMTGFSKTKTRMQKTHDFSASQVDGSIFVRHMHQISNALLKVLASEPPFSVLIQWHTGWCLRKLLVFQEKKLNDHDFHLFNVFVLHLQLKPFIFGGDPFENPLINLQSSLLAISGRKYASDLSSASFGSELALGSGIPCKIACLKAGIKDIYMIPVARGISGKLLLAEKHPLHTKRGVVISLAPLAGLSPKIDDNHSTWLHLQIREFDPRFDASKTRGNHSSTSIHEADGRWTLGFSTVEACEAARSMILEETSKQKLSVESLLATLLQDNSPGNLSDSQGE